MLSEISQYTKTIIICFISFVEATGNKDKNKGHKSKRETTREGKRGKVDIKELWRG
jgi:hypothetical protein